MPIAQQGPRATLSLLDVTPHACMHTRAVDIKPGPGPCLDCPAGASSHAFASRYHRAATACQCVVHTLRPPNNNSPWCLRPDPGGPPVYTRRNGNTFVVSNEPEAAQTTSERSRSRSRSRSRERRRRDRFYEGRPPPRQQQQPYWPPPQQAQRPPHGSCYDRVPDEAAWASAWAAETERPASSQPASSRRSTAISEPSQQLPRAA